MRSKCHECGMDGLHQKGCSQSYIENCVGVYTPITSREYAQYEEELEYRKSHSASIFYVPVLLENK